MTNTNASPLVVTTQTEVILSVPLQMAAAAILSFTNSVILGFRPASVTLDVANIYLHTKLNQSEVDEVHLFVYFQDRDRVTQFKVLGAL